MLAIGLLPTLIVSGIGYATTSNELTSKTVDQLVSTASKQEQKINGLLQQRQEEVTTLINRFDLQTALGQYLTFGNARDRSTMDGILLDKKIQTPDIQSITITDLNGKILASTIDGTEGSTLLPEQYAVDPTSGASITVREDPRDSIDKLNITTKVIVNKKDSGIVNVVFRIDDITAAIQDYTGLGITGETVVASKDKTGNSISLFPLRFDTDAALTKNLNSLNLFTTKTTSVATDYRGNQVLVTPRAIGFSDWVIATKIDMDEALAPVVQLRNTFIITLILSSIGIMILTLWLTGFFSRPILRIARAAQQIGKGNFSVRVNMKRDDEIGVLGDSINTMGVSLKEFVSHIESERNRLEVILNGTVESILAIDKLGTILIANHATTELTKLRQRDIVGKKISDVFAWTHEMQLFSIDYSIEGANSYPDLQYTDHEGGTHFVRIIVARVKSEEQTAAQTIVTVHDQTKTRELENMKIDFVSMAAHELRTPLASLRGYIELISYKESSHISEEANKYLRQALKSSNQLGGLINNLLDVTRIERGTLTLTMEKVDLAASIAQAVTDLRLSAEDKNIRLVYDGLDNGSLVIGDHIALREVINNLLGNAIKYTQPGGAVTISVQRQNDQFIVHVKDTGMGIPKKALPYLFTKFYRVHGGLDSGSTGTGLGLFISKSIIERHNGTISVDSTEGAGSTFTFTVPVLNEDHLARLQTEKQSDQVFIRRHRGWITKNTTR
jgi:PAS domain S-box-containing protein